MYSFQHLLLLETSTHELLRLPTDATLKSFEDELRSLHVRSAVGHLCTLITREYDLTTRIPLNVYRTSMRTWFIHLQSLAMVQGNNEEPMQYILDFLTYLPVYVGQARLIQEIVLGPLDDVFWKSGVNAVSARTRIWKLADEKQRNKLEIWGHTLDINEWKNSSKWSGQDYSVEDQVSLLEPSENRTNSSETIVQAIHDMLRIHVTFFTDDTYMPTTIPAAAPTLSTTPQSHSNPIEVKSNNENGSAQAAFEHIESIRRGFGVDSGLDSSGQSIVNNLQGMIERSLQKLSNDLYSEQGHFVLELIQNADDNQYASDRLPTLRFVLSDKRILVCNNEIGFQPNNVAAICNVGATTKGKHKQGYAGHKGIGFKSVFMVSDRPEIHSGDYHFCFDTVDGTQQIGYIRPIWLDKWNEELSTANEWTTCICLPIQRGSRLQENFDNIQAKLLLFLNRLRRIEIVGQPISASNSDQSRIFTRFDHADGKIIELQEKTVNGTIIKNFWLVVKKVLQVPQDIKEKLREVKCDVHSTTIAIAYPLSGLQQSVQQLPSAQPLFAYLPLRSYGFRFILQADFEIPVTRQEILHDNIWNEWLKSEMIQLLPLAYTQFQNLPDLLTSSLPESEIGSPLTAIQVLIYFLKLIPTRNELDPYFNSFVDKSMKLLMGIIKLPVSREDENGQMHIEWVQTSQCVFIKDPFIRKILPQQLLLTHFNMYYVPEQLASEFAQWLLCIDYILQQQPENEQSRGSHNERIETTTIAELKQLKIIPLNGQSRLVSIDEYNEQVILFPLSKTAQYKKPFKIVLDDLPRLDERLLEYIENKCPRRYESIECLLKKLGMIDKPKIKDIYRLYMRPTLLDSTRWSTKADYVLIAYLLCIYIHFDQFKNELDQLQKHMVIKTRSGQFVCLDTPDFINVSQLQSTQWAYLMPELNEMIRQPFIVEDCCCNEFNRLVAPSNNTVADIDLYSKLLIYLDRYHAVFSRYYMASIISIDQLKSGGRRPEKSIPSTFCLSLRQHAWIPIEGGQLAKPDDVYCLHPKSETLFFHRYVPHLDQAKLSLNNRDFILNTLGLKEHVLPMTIRGGGDFLFPRQVYWHDSTLLLSNLDNITMPNSDRRISIQRYYGNDVKLQKFFLEILQITFEPTIDDYLPLLTQITNINDIWRLSEVIIRLAFQQNRQIEVKDRPFYPHDPDIANVLANILPIIQLPDNKTVESTEESTHTVEFHTATIACSNSTVVEVATFQHIQISTLTGSNLYPLSPSSITINPTSNMVDNTIGRQGEELVFRFLQWKHPNKHVEWMNAKQESGLPYDIQIRTNNEIEMIEVKTTRIHDQHTFQISISEIECLLKNPMHYHIYRVYYSDDPDSTKITILSQVKYHLEEKQLALCMTMMQRADEQ
ncbi:unnamed protein product [Rotaria sp. Silwood1]|nr:unnamed protein product [Rotaria sp. Silwood1]